MFTFDISKSFHLIPCNISCNCNKWSSTSNFIWETDPCDSDNHIILPVTEDRSTSCQNEDIQLCDSELKTAWYRPLFQNIDVRMPTSCVDQNSCGTRSPIWLNGTIIQLLFDSRNWLFCKVIMFIFINNKNKLTVKRWSSQLYWLLMQT